MHESQSEGLKIGKKASSAILIEFTPGVFISQRKNGNGDLRVFHGVHGGGAQPQQNWSLSLFSRAVLGVIFFVLVARVRKVTYSHWGQQHRDCRRYYFVCQDYKGQELSETLYQLIILLFSVSCGDVAFKYSRSVHDRICYCLKQLVGFIWGYQVQSFKPTVDCWFAGLGIASAVRHL